VAIGASNPTSPLPSPTSNCQQGDQRIPLTHQVSVAELGLSGGIGRRRSAVELPEQRLAPAVDHVEQRNAVPARGVLRLDDVEVGRELDLPLRVLRCEVDVGDDRVPRVLRVDGEVDLAHDLLVGAGLAKRLAREDILAALHVDARDFGTAGRRRQGREQPGHREELHFRDLPAHDPSPLLRFFKDDSRRPLHEGRRAWSRH